MLSFKELSEKKKTQCKINPKLDDLKEKHCDDKKKKVKCPECMGEGCGHCDGKGYHMKESAVPGKPAEKLKTDRNMFSIPKDEREAAAERLKAKAAAKRKAKLKEEDAYVSQEEVSKESNQSINEEETSNLLTFGQFNEDRAADAKKSLDAVKKRQKVLDAHEKKTGTKLDINKSVEARAHKKNFPGAKRTGKKVKGAKETELQQHNRRVSKHNQRLMKHGPTKKEAERQKGYDAYEKKHKRGNKSVWD